MNIRFRLLPALAIALSLQPLSAAEPDQTAPTAQPSPVPTDDVSVVVVGEKDKPEPERKYCHREIQTGSISPVRVCRTKAEMDAETKQGQAQLDKFRTDQARQQQVQSAR